MDESSTGWQQLGDSGVFIEVELRGGREDVGLLDSIPFERVTTLVGEIAHHIGSAIKKAQPSKATVEVGIEFGLEEGKLVALIARGSTKANLKISMEWAHAET